MHLPAHLWYNRDMKLQIISCNPCNEPLPMPEEEVEQRLTISSCGQVWFAARSFRQHQAGQGTIWFRHVGIGRWKAEHIINCFAGYLIKDYRATWCDGGDWSAAITDAEGRRIFARGQLRGGVTYRRADLSQLIRRIVPIRDMWVFDAATGPDYAGITAIQGFVRKWQQAFREGRPEIAGGSIDFGAACLACGFNMDDGAEFARRCRSGDPGKCADLEVLGAGIYSRWHQVIREHGDLMRGENREWFMAALEHLGELAGERSRDRLQKGVI